MPPALSPGAKLGPYEIIGPLGEGGMGEVWQARDPRLNRTVAIKVSKNEFNERFEREARAIFNKEYDLVHHAAPFPCISGRRI